MLVWLQKPTPRCGVDRLLRLVRSMEVSLIVWERFVGNVGGDGSGDGSQSLGQIRGGEEEFDERFHQGADEFDAGADGAFAVGP